MWSHLLMSTRFKEKSFNYLLVAFEIANHFPTQESLEKDAMLIDIAQYIFYNAYRQEVRLMPAKCFSNVLG